MLQTKTQNYKIADIELAEWGKKEIEIAEAEMPGLLSICEEYKWCLKQPLIGARSPTNMLVSTMGDYSNPIRT